MLKKANLKIAAVIAFCAVLLTAAAIAVQMAELLISDRNSFRRDAGDLFSGNFVSQITQAANHTEFINTPIEGQDAMLIESSVSEEDRIAEMSSITNAQFYEINRTGSRAYCILDADSLDVLYSSDRKNDDGIDKTPTVLSAADGNTASNITVTGKLFEYAFPISDDGKINYIIYLTDTRGGLFSDLDHMTSTGIKLLAAVFLLAFLAGLRITVWIARPINNISERAKLLAKGNMKAFDDITPVLLESELAGTMKNMARSFSKSQNTALKEQVKLETILKNMHDGILAFDMKGKIIHINPEAQRMLNRKYLDDIEFDRFFKEINVNISLGDFVYLKQDGSTIERSATLSKDSVLRFNFAVFKTSEKDGGILVVIHDVTKQERLEESRRNFVADVSHELRTPLTTIKSYSETLKDNPDADKSLQIRFLDVIASEADRMARIISDLLTLSQLDENISVLRAPERIDVRKMLEQITDRMELSARKKEQTLLYTPINEVPEIYGDSDGLERVFLNVISNAIKYTSRGGRIEIFSSKVYNDVCVKVTDNGIGIPKEHLPHIFDRFYRVDKARSRDTGGTGLGLAIAKQIVESCFNGKIMISSEINQGTEVTITLPAPKE